VSDSIPGTVGAAINDDSPGCKIQKHLRVVEECACLSSSQLGHMLAIESTVSSNVERLRADVESLEQSVVAERRNIFSIARFRVMHG